MTLNLNPPPLFLIKDSSRNTHVKLTRVKLSLRMCVCFGEGEDAGYFLTIKVNCFVHHGNAVFCCFKDTVDHSFI